MKPFLLIPESIIINQHLKQERKKLCYVFSFFSQENFLISI